MASRTIPKIRKSATILTADPAADSGSRPNGYEKNLSFDPKTQRYTDGDKVPYIDDDRDLRDFVIASAIRSAIYLIDNGSKHEAANVLRLAEWKLESSWPADQRVNCTGEVARG